MTTTMRYPHPTPTEAPYRSTRSGSANRAWPIRSVSANPAGVTRSALIAAATTLAVAVLFAGCGGSPAGRPGFARNAAIESPAAPPAPNAAADDWSIALPELEGPSYATVAAATDGCARVRISLDAIDFAPPHGVEAEPPASPATTTAPSPTTWHRIPLMTGYPDPVHTTEGSKVDQIRRTHALYRSAPSPTTCARLWIDGRTPYAAVGHALYVLGQLGIADVRFLARSGGYVTEVRTTLPDWEATEPIAADRNPRLRIDRTGVRLSVGIERLGADCQAITQGDAPTIDGSLTATHEAATTLDQCLTLVAGREDLAASPRAMLEIGERTVAADLLAALALANHAFAGAVLSAPMAE